MVFYIKWEMDAFSHEHLLTWENATKSILMKEPGILIPILLLISSFLLNIHPMVSSIIWIVYVFSHNYPIACLNFVIVWEESEILLHIRFTRDELFHFRRTSVPWGAKKRQSLQFLQNMFLLPTNILQMVLEVFCKGNIQYYMEQ